MKGEFKIQITPRRPEAGRFALFSLGFRPFFFFGCLFAIVSPLQWMLGYRGLIAIPGQYHAAGWHAHEMYFGYAAAVIAGFLLTSVRIWTREDTITGKPLLILSAVWLLARVLPLLQVVPLWLPAVVDLIFLPLLALAIAVPIVKARQWNNSVFPLLLLVMAAGNLAIHLAAHYPQWPLARTGLTLALYCVLLLIVIMAGRVIPWFISHSAAGSRPRSWRLVEMSSNWSVALLGLLSLLAPVPWLLAAAAGVTAALHAVRLYFWTSLPVWRVPLLWILIVAYAWVVLGLVLLCFASLGWVIPFLPLHAFTVGSIGAMTLGLMARVSLGHSGRAMQLHPLTISAFVLVNIAALVRVLLPMLYPHAYVWAMVTSTLLWVLAFSAFLIVYTPILLKK